MCVFLFLFRPTKRNKILCLFIALSLCIYKRFQMYNFNSLKFISFSNHIPEYKLTTNFLYFLQMINKVIHFLSDGKQNHKHVTKVRITVSFDEAVDMFKTSVVTLKRHIYSKRAQNRTYKESLDHGELLVHVDYAESYKNVQQNEIQSAYFGNSTFSIFPACCYTKSLDEDDVDGLKKDSVVVVSESKEHNRTAAFTCLKKVIEEVLRANGAK